MTEKKEMSATVKKILAIVGTVLTVGLGFLGLTEAKDLVSI